jgi:hypothetical protein
MRAYLVKTTDGENKKFCGTQAQVSEYKKELMAGGAKRKDISVSDVEIPDDKQGKLDFINSVVNRE